MPAPPGTYNGLPFLLDRHLRRLRASAAAIGLAVPLYDAAFGAGIDGTMEALDADEPPERYVRLVLTRGVGELSYDPAPCSEPSLVIIVRRHREVAAAVWERGVRLVRRVETLPGPRRRGADAAPSPPACSKA